MVITNPADQASALAKSYREADGAIASVLWFPNDEEIRVLLVSPEIGSNFNEPEIHPFIFRPRELEDTESPSAVAYISPLEVGKVKLPAGWGEWSDAREV